jgi:hypothetical protein
LAGALLAAICWYANRYFFLSGQALSQWKKIVDLMITIAVASAMFFGAAYVLRVAELHDVVELLRRKLSRNGGR